MKQKALVKAISGKYAVVEVTRSAMCDGCSQKDCGKHTCSAGAIFGAGKKMSAKARNPMNAVPGDTVMVETEEKTLLWDAALVFLMPLLLCGIFYWIADLLFHNVTAAYCAAAVGFILAFCLLGYIEHIRKEKVPDIVIVEILPQTNQADDNSCNIENEMD
ncbi:MAG: SoxR reducing system RseC family protein [Clostridia bacterium]|nr:SoxR reducing system RseC family protein [Clostridia bacterium]